MKNVFIRLKNSRSGAKEHIEKSISSLVFGIKCFILKKYKYRKRGKQQEKLADRKNIMRRSSIYLTVPLVEDNVSKC